MVEGLHVRMKKLLVSMFTLLLNVKIHISGQIMATSAEVTPKGSLVGESSQNSLNYLNSGLVNCPIFVYFCILTSVYRYEKHDCIVSKGKCA